MNLLNATELCTVKWCLLHYVNLTSIKNFFLFFLSVHLVGFVGLVLHNIFHDLIIQKVNDFYKIQKYRNKIVL